jgi:hypothetical protein
VPVLKFIFFLTLPLFASDYRVEKQVIPTIVSGSLTPLVLSIDGIVILKSDEKILSIQVEDRTYQKKKMGKAPIYQKITSDKFTIVFNWKEKEKEERVFELPTLLDLQFKGKTFDVKISENTHSITLNGKDIQTEVTTQELAKVFVFELKRNEPPLTRLYNVTVDVIPPPPQIIRQEIPLHVSYSVLEDVRRWVHLGAGIYLPSRWAFSGYVEVSLPVKNVWGRFAVGARAGYQILRETDGDNDPIWLESGLSVRTVFRYIDGYALKLWGEGRNSSYGNAQSGLQAGPYLKTVPLRFKNWGLGFTIETEIFMNTLSSGGATITLLELYYHL